MYLKLMKVFFKEGFSLKRMFNITSSKSKLQSVLIGLLLLYGLGTILFGFGYIFLDLGLIFNNANMIEFLLMYVFIYSSSLSIIFILLRANGYLFQYKDFELLEPLPIKPRIVVFAKASVMMIIVYISVFLFTAPMAFSYFYYTGFNIVSLLFYFIAILCVPLIPAVIFSFIALLIARITAKFRKNKLITIILMFIAFLGVMYISFAYNFSGGTNPMLNQEGFIAGMGEIYLPMMWFVNAIHNRDIFNLLLLIVTHVFPFFLFLILIQKMVLTTNQKGLMTITRKNNKPVLNQQRSVFNSIITKESRKFFSVPIYALNTGFGPIILFVLSVLSLIYKDKILEYLPQLGFVGLSTELILLIIICFCLSTVYTSAISLSLEGKNFWIIKTLPVQPEKIMFAKMAFNVLLGLPIALFSLVLFGISFQIQLYHLFILALYITTFSFLTSILGSIINLYTPKFHYKNETEVVKQSIGAILGIFGGMGIILINVGIYSLLKNALSWQLNVMVNSLFDLILFFLAFYFVKKVTESLFTKMAV